jgi:hypothetical protein
MLLAQIEVAMRSEKGAQIPLSVDQIIFNTRPVFAEIEKGPHLRAENSRMHASSDRLEVENQYYLNEPLSIQSEMSIPLATYDQLNNEKKYFLLLEQGQDPTYGYILTLDSQIPKGNATIYDRSMALIGRTTLQIYGATVIVKVAPAEDLLSTIIIRESSEQLDFEVRVDSNLEINIEIIFELPIRERFIQSNPPVDDKLPGLLIWYQPIQPGENLFKGSVRFAPRDIY